MYLYASPWRSHCPFVYLFQAVVELLEGLTSNLFSKGVLELETWVTIQRMCIFESADFTTHLWFEEVSCCGMGNLS